MKYYYISDLHFGHEHIISLCNRPYSTTEEMNKSIIRICNETVQKDDVLVILGDVANYYYNAVKDLKSISCKKILITGNHDRHWLKDREFRHCFVDIVENEIIYDGKYKIFLSHYPMAEWDGFYKGIYHFYGHIHNSPNAAATVMTLYEKAVNVGIDVIQKPRTAEELIRNRKAEFDKGSQLTIQQLLKTINDPLG